MLAPAKNRSGQRIYREHDVEIVLLIKRLLYGEGFTIAGARKRIPEELKRQGEAIEGEETAGTIAPIFPELNTSTPAAHGAAGRELTVEDKLMDVRAELEGLLTLLDGTM